MLLDCPYTSKNLANLRRAEGPCRCCLKGKTTNPPQQPSTSEPAELPGIKQHIDILFVKTVGPNKKPTKVPYMIFVDDNLDYILGYRLVSRTRENIEDAFDKMFAFYASIE